MRQDLNPVVIALEMKIEELRQRLHYYERKEFYETPILTPSGPLDEKIGFQEAPTITLPLTASIKAAHDVYRGYHVIARTYPRNPVAGIGVSYYVNEQDMWSVRDQAYCLYMMNERLSLDLAKHIGKG